MEKLETEALIPFIDFELQNKLRGQNPHKQHVNINEPIGCEKRSLSIECVRSCDQKPYLHNETKGGICIKIEFNPQKNSSLLQDGRRFFVYSFNMAAVTSCEHTI